MAIRKKQLKRFIMYAIRWELSTPVLALCLFWLGGLGEWPATIIANFIGSIIFYFVDKIIFREDR